VAMDARVPPMDWDEFSRDLIVAAHFTRTVGVCSLEGCVRQGFLPRLRTLDWKAPVVLPAESIDRANQFRARVSRVLWIGSRLPWLLGGLQLAVAAAITGVRRWRRRRSVVAA